MSKMVQIRNVPEEPHRALKARAALQGKSLSRYLLDEVALLVQRPTAEELRRRLASRSRPRLSRRPSEVLREERENR